MNFGVAARSNERERCSDLHEHTHGVRARPFFPRADLNCSSRPILGARPRPSATNSRRHTPPTIARTLKSNNIFYACITNEREKESAIFGAAYLILDAKKHSARILELENFENLCRALLL